MKSAKIIVGLVVIALAGVVSIYIFASGKINDLPAINSENNASSTGNDIAAATIKNYISEELPEKIASEWQMSDTQNLTANAAAIDPNNLTELFASELAKEVVMKNPEGPLTYDDGSQKINFPGTLDYETFLKQSEGQTDWKKLISPEENIKTSADNSTDALAQYLKSLETILSTRSQQDLSLSTNITDVGSVENDGKVLGQKIVDYLADLRAITVPDKLASFHRQLLQILKGKEIAFLKLANSKNDPLSALVAVGWLQDISQVETSVGEGLLTILKETLPKK